MELNALVSQYVLGHQVIRQKKGTMKEKTRQGQIRPLRNYCADIAAAWEIVDKVGVTLIPIENGMWFGIIGPRDRWKSPGEFLCFLQAGQFLESGAAIEKSAPLTICLAALKSVEKRLPPEVWNVSSSNVVNEMTN